MKSDDDLQAALHDYIQDLVWSISPRVVDDLVNRGVSDDEEAEENCDRAVELLENADIEVIWNA